MQIGILARLGAARIDHDQFRPPRGAHGLHALIDDRVAPGGVRSDQNEQVGLVEIVIARGHDILAEGAQMAGDRARHAQPRIGVDIGRADEALHQLVGDVIILGQQLARDVESDAVGPVLRDRIAQAARDQRRAPCPSLRAACRSSGGAGAPRARSSRPDACPSSRAARHWRDDRHLPRSRRYARR
jgi:hypothetical protein